MQQLNLTSTQTHKQLGAETLVPAVIMSLCFLVGFPGNVAALFLRPNWQQLSTLTQCLMVNLASSDLLCLVTLPFWIHAILYDWTLGAVGCKIITLLAYCSIYSSALTVTALSVQRYMQVVHPHRSLKFKKRLLILMWLMSMVLSIPTLVVRQVTVDQQKISCFVKYSSQAQQLAVMFAECTFGFSSLIICVWAYITLKRKLTQTAFFNSPSTFKLVTTLTITFFVSWFPYLVFLLVIVVAILSNHLKIADFYYSGFNIFGSSIIINSSINPLLYAFASKLFKRNGELQPE